MAKPGHPEQARKARAQGLDLAAAKLSPEQAARIGERLELAQGMRCGGCGRRITVGFRFVSIAPRDAQAPVIKLSACNRDDCNQAQELRREATVVEMVEFAWLDEAGADARAMPEIVERNRRLAGGNGGG